MTLWFHPPCAAYKRPEALLEGLRDSAETPADRDSLEAGARAALAHRRLVRVDGAERATSGQAKCRHCRERIERGTWRIRLAFFEEGRFSPGGFVHVACHPAYFEDHDVLAALLHFSPDLEANERVDLERTYSAAPSSP